jgi:AraC family transcriptional regulator
MTPHNHNTWGISVVLGGALEETSGRSGASGSVASVVVKPPGIVHADRFGPQGARILSLLVAPGAIPEWCSGAPCLTQWRWVEATAALPIALRLIRQGPTGGAEAVDAALVALADLLVTLPQATPQRPPRWLADIRDRIHAEFPGCCRVRRLAEVAGVHPVYLARAYRYHYRRSVTEELREIRVRAAAKRLADSDEPVARIAAAVGFADQSHLCRVFCRFMGAPPKVYRRLLHQG